VVRDLAQQQLGWRELRGAAPELEKLVAESLRPVTRAQALWALQGLGALQSAVVVRAMADVHPGVRRQAVRLSEAWAKGSPELLPAIIARADDTDAGVRLQAAYSLGEWHEPAAGEALARLLRREDDRFVKAAAMSSALPHAETLMAALQRDGGAENSLLVEVATVTENAKALAGLLTAIAGRSEAGDWPAAFRSLAQLLDWLQRNNKTLAQLQRTADEPMQRALAGTDALFAAARRVAAEANAPAADRVAAVRTVRVDRPDLRGVRRRRSCARHAWVLQLVRLTFG
jgi:HEAT repeat protein